MLPASPPLPVKFPQETPAPPENQTNALQSNLEKYQNNIFPFFLGIYQKQPSQAAETPSPPPPTANLFPEEL